MKDSKIAIGATYQIKVGRNLCEVKINSQLESGGWLATSVKSGKPIKIRDASRLLKLISKPGVASAKAKCSDTVKPDATVPKHSLINAAAIVLQACKRPLSCNEIIEKAIDADIWQPGKGKTPANTLYASILREIKTKGVGSRFAKTGRCKFEFIFKTRNQ